MIARKIITTGVGLMALIMTQASFAEDSDQQTVTPRQSESTQPQPSLAIHLQQNLESQGWRKETLDDGSVVYRQPTRETIAENLKRQLAEQGWSEEKTEDGSVIYRKELIPKEISQVESGLSRNLEWQLMNQGWLAFPQPDGSVIYRQLPRDEVAIQAEGSLASKLVNQLKEHNWTIETLDDGSVIYRKPEVKKKSSESTQPQEALARDLKRKLEAQGWEAQTQEDGSVVYRKPLEVETLPAMQEQLAGQLQRNLEAQGWRAETQDDGSVVYRRPTMASMAATVEKRNLAMAENLKKQLDAQGWVAESQKDGSVLYRRSASVPFGSQWTEMLWFSMPGPVADEDEAATLAQRWLEYRSLDGELTVGKLRKVNKVFVVSIVVSESPHNLKHQLIINNEYGNIIVVH